MILFAEETTQRTLSTLNRNLTTFGWRKQVIKFFAFEPNWIAIKIAEMVIYIMIYVYIKWISTNDPDADTCFYYPDK